MVIKVRNTKGITLIALVITIIILLILAAVSISVVIGENGILSRAQDAVQGTKNSEVDEQVKFIATTTVTEQYQGKGFKDSIEEAIKSYPNFTIESIDEVTGKAIIVETETGRIYEINSISGVTYLGTVGEDERFNGTWSEERQVNTPQLMIGMTAVYWTGTAGDYIEHELTSSSSETDWATWYDYSDNKWANAVTKDNRGNITGYWVWIPRYEYSISGTTININFIKTNTTTASTGYKIHPSFIDGTDNHYENGEWDSELAGFWVAKYTAGYQASSIDSSGNVTNSSDTVSYSNFKYTSYYSGYITNALSQDLTSIGYSSESISYPVFKPQTYAYNVISTGDSYSISIEIAKASSFYGLSSNKTDSHMMKNSEWGAVAYLTQSSYGRHGIEANINNLNLNGLNSKKIHAVTGFGGVGQSTSETTNISSVSTYDTATGILASSTGNIYGVYDLNGCAWERVAGYIANSNSNLTTYGSSYTTSAISTKYVTVYPYNISSDTNENNWIKYNESNSVRYGDAILETSTAGSGTTSWNSDYSGFSYTNEPFIVRGGCYEYGSSSGIFAFQKTLGNPAITNSFRAVISQKN